MSYANGAVRKVAVFGADPTPGGTQARGAMRAAWRRVNGFLTIGVPLVGGGRFDPSLRYSGPLPASPAPVRAAQNATANQSVFRNGGTADISSLRSTTTLTDPVMRIFARRLADQTGGQ